MSVAIERRATRWLFEQLVAGGLLELESDDHEVLTTLVEHATTWIGEHVDEAARAARFSRFLEQHPSVAETFASDELLEQRLAAWQSAVRRFAPGSPHREPALEEQIYDNPDDEALRLVYGDWLQQHGDPLGELIVRARANERATKRLLSEQAEYFFGPAKEYLRLFKLAYQFGTLRSITVTRKSRVEIEWPIVTGWLLDRPIARFVQDVQIGPLPTLGSEAAVWNALLGTPRPALRRIEVTGSSWGYDPCDLTLLCDGAPRIEELHLRRVRVEAAAPMELRTLRRLRVSMPIDPRPGSLMSILGASTFPALEELVVSWTTGSIAPVLQLTAPALRVLRAPLGGEATDIVHRLATGALLPNLEELELTGLDDAGARILLANVDRFAHLRALVLPNHEVKIDTLRALSRRLPVQIPADDDPAEDPDDE